MMSVTGNMRDSGESKPYSQHGEEDFLYLCQTDPSSFDSRGNRRPTDSKTSRLELFGTFGINLIALDGEQLSGFVLLVDVRREKG